MALQRVRSNMLANNFVLDDDQGLTVGSGNNIYIDTINNQVGINTNTTTHALTVNGDISATNFYGDGSQLTGLSSTLDEVTTNGATTTNSITVGGLIVNSTGALELPVGTTAQRPASINGSIRFNSDLVAFEGYDGNEWGALGGGGATYSTTAPTTNLKEGDLWFDTGTTGELYVYSGSEWLSVTGSGDASGFYQRDFTGDASTTAFNVYGPANSDVFVYINGVLVAKPADYSYANGIVTFVTPPSLNDEISVYVFGGASSISLTSLGLNSTDDISEGSTNLYYTDARVQNYLDTAGTLTETDTLATVTGRGASTTTNVEFNGTGNSVLVGDTLRIAQTGSGLRMTNVGAFDNDGSDNFRLFATNTLYLRANGETGGGIVIDDVNQNVTIDNDLIVSGNLTVNGTTTTINSTTLTVDDLNITLASGAADAAAANGAGITVDGASANITYNGTNDEWEFNKRLQLDNDEGVHWGTGNGRPYIKGDQSVGILQLSDGGTPSMTVKTDNIGITDSNPLSKLVVSDGVQTSTGISGGGTFIEVARTSGGDAGLIIQKNTANWVMGVDNSDGNAAPLRFEYSPYGAQPLSLGAGTLGLALSYNGGVGIGTTLPGAKLDVQGVSSAPGDGSQIFQVTNSTGGTKLAIGVHENNGAWIRSYESGFGGRDLILQDIGGNVGINTSTASVKLHIQEGSSGGGLTEAFRISDNTYTNISMYSGGADGEIKIGAAGQLRGSYKAQYAGTGGAYNFNIGTNATNAITIDTSQNVSIVSGDLTPGTATQDLGTPTDPWQNIYTQDMHLSNESRETGNEIDGTKGNWTIQEGAEDLYIINNKTGKRFRFKLEEIQ